MKWKTILTTVLAVLVVALLAVPALAVDDGHEIPRIKEKLQWVPLVYLLVSLAGISVVAFKKTRRTHLD